MISKTDIELLRAWAHWKLKEGPVGDDLLILTNIKGVCSIAIEAKNLYPVLDKFINPSEDADDGDIDNSYDDVLAAFKDFKDVMEK